MPSNPIRHGSQCSPRTPKRSRACVWRVAAAMVFTLGLAGGEIRAQTAPAWAFKEGDVLRYKIHYKTEVTVKAVAGVDAPNDPGPDLDVTLSWAVTRVGSDGTALITQRIEHIRERMRQRSYKGPPLVYDSADPKTINNAWSESRRIVYRPILGASYRLTIDRRGDVTDIKIPDGALAGWEELRLRPGDSKDLFFTKDGVNDLLSVMPRLPEGPVARGGAWQSRRETASGTFRKTLVENYSPAGREGRLVTFEATPELVVQVIPPPALEGDQEKGSLKMFSPVTVKVEAQSGLSRLTFDEIAGFLTMCSRRHRYKLKTTFNVPAGAGIPSGEKSTISTTTTESDIELISVGPAR